jgi:DNA polymerase III alpha subunit
MVVRSGYSFRTAYGSLRAVADRLIECGYRQLPIADLNSTFSFVQWEATCRKLGFKPAFGVTLAVGNELKGRRRPLDEWSFFPRHSLRDINNLVQVASGQGWQLTYDQAYEAVALGRVNAIAGPANLFLCPATPGLYQSLSPATTAMVLDKAMGSGWPLLATSANRFPRASDDVPYQLLAGARADSVTYPRHILTEAEWRASLAQLPLQATELDKALVHRDTLLEVASGVELSPGEMFTPTKSKTLLALCLEGAQQKGCDLSRPEYMQRMSYELDLIAKKKFEDYFYIVSGMIRWAKERMIVGPARGSSCGSLVCYLLDITTVDPLEHGLIFERFIDINRKDLPDIDIDFSADHRDEVFKYARQMYGEDHVARLGTITMLQPRSLLNMAAKELQIPDYEIRSVTDSIIKRSSGDSRALQKMSDTFNETAQGKKLVEKYPFITRVSEMEGHPYGHSQHSAGLLISRGQILDHVAVDASGVAQCDKYDAEKLNLLKIDALGLTQLSIFERTLELLGIRNRRFLETIPLDDAAAYDVINKQHFSGIFQFEGTSLQSICRQVRVSQFNDIVSITALARPGPMASGGTMSWVLRMSGKEPVSYPDPAFEPETNDTLGVICYQEQVMNIGRNIGGLSWEDVTALRKAMSKSLGKEFFDQYGDRWKAGARAKGISDHVLDKMWDDLCAYGAWCFNKAHAVAYAYVSYYCMWFKAHHPVEFAAATLDYTDDQLKQIAILRELSREGIEYIPFDRELSAARWSTNLVNGKKVLVGPLSNVKGIGPAYIKEIMTSRDTGKTLRAVLEKRLANAVTPIDTLYPISERGSQLLAESKVVLNGKITNVGDIKQGDSGEFRVLALVTKIAPRDENEEVNIARRGYKVDGPTATLNMFMQDDTGEIFAKIDRWRFPKLGQEVVDRGKAGRALYLVRGKCPSDFRMLRVDAIKYLGDLT